jgi:hypothetical protein
VGTVAGEAIGRSAAAGYRKGKKAFGEQISAASGKLKNAVRNKVSAAKGHLSDSYNSAKNKFSSFFSRESSSGVGASVDDVPKKSGPIELNEITTFQDFRSRSVVGDNLEGHELLQHANLNERNLARTRLSTEASKNNPVIALDKTVHTDVNKAQRAIDPRAQSGVENIEANAKILREHPEIPNSAVDQLEDAASRHNEDLLR